MGAETYRVEYDGETDDYEDTFGYVRVNHRFNPQFTGFVAYRHTLHQFDEDINDYKIYDGSIGFDYAIDPTMDLTVEIHYFIRDYDEESR